MTTYGSSHQQPSVEDVLSGPSGSGVPAFKFPQGQSPVTFTGTVIDQEAQQQREYMPDGGIGKPLFWDDGKPKMQVVVTAKQEGTGDEYRLYMRGQALSAARQALASAEAKSFEPGGTIVMAYVRDEKLKSGYKSKFFEIEYRPADKAAASVSDVLGTQDAVPAPKPAPEVEVKTEPAAPQQVSIDPSTLSPDAMDALKRAGLLGS